MGKTSTRYAALLAAGLCAGALLTGCGGDDKPSPPPTGGGTVAGGPTTAPPSEDPGSTTPVDPRTSSAPTSAKTSQPTKTAKPTKSGKDSPDEAGAPGVPPAARQHTKKGAEAFARHYVQLINGTGLKPRKGVLEPLSSSACGSCKNFENNVNYLAQHNQHNSGPAVTVRRTVAQFDPAGTTTSWVLMDQNAMRILNENGQTVDTVSPIKEVTLVFYLNWEHGQWFVNEIKVDRTGSLPS